MALWRVPLDADQIEVPLGIVHIIKERCKGCGYCIEFCPKEVLEFSKEFNQKGYHPPRVKKPDDCVNCHYCEIICPEFAIYSLEADKEQANQ
ncbi:MULTISPECIES: 4Fe-4S dicluster domain-containing protein [Desulfatibacillum]|uniref:4Fe-4S cluster domain protein associated with 2-oxoglutarate synthase n=2 Tax=Desulfatibacillum TaxID=218207 RepID=B8FAN2_DESAL|nr:MULTISPECIES: ferredoxin family protein [Desulfatibacillum]ACL03328.1 4Fe-4S cluster domain protein associated with 2-oxoglutarate synthase [Desulfatibacillum aliphaticivorans]SHJ39295.1 2-oxoglutarate ferredoxin oxidoreductase subunit delta [Desulfatibacillum alkenivorans DSM 16219]